MVRRSRTTKISGESKGRITRREICRRAGGKWRYREDENWASPVLQRMVEDRIVESDDSGRFRLMKQASADSNRKRKLWLSPAIKRIFKESGRNFGVLDLDQDADTQEQLASLEPSLSYEVQFQR